VKSVHSPRPRTAKSALAPRAARAAQTPSVYVPAKATADQYFSAQPAMLVVWQESYSDDGSVMMIQQSFYQVVVLKNVTPKEQPAKTT
jgi:hypothetical protein